MRIRSPILEGRFLRRYKRFFADIELPDGAVVTAHCPNTGSLLGCLEAGRTVLLRDSENPARKLRYTFQAIRLGRRWVNVDTSLPNAAVFEDVVKGRIPELAGYDAARREVPYGTRSRIDLLLEKDTGERCYVEIKSTTLAEDGIAFFPDAVTERGRKHLTELAQQVAEGHRAVQFFFVSRGDVSSLRPADHIDPAYGAALRAAGAAGVEILAYAARVRRDAIGVDHRLQVELSPLPNGPGRARRERGGSVPG